MTSTLLCLAVAIYFEARSEPLLGQIAVAEVIVNRSEDPRFPDNVCAVVEQKGNGKCQFSFYCDTDITKIREPEAYNKALVVASYVLMAPEQVQVTDGALYFHTPAVKPSWSKRMERTAEIGDHIFLTDKVTEDDK